MIKQGDFKKEIKRIYNSSSKQYITSQSNDIAIGDPDMRKYVYIDDNTAEVVGYISMYEKSDFIEKEEFDVKINNIRKDSVYIWEVGTMKGHEGKGIASQLIKEITELYPNRDIYSCVECENIPSLRIHEKNGFRQVKSFEGHFFGDETEIYLILKLDRHKKRTSK